MSRERGCSVLHWLSPVVALLGCGDGAPERNGQAGGSGGSSVVAGASGFAASGGAAAPLGGPAVAIAPMNGTGGAGASSGAGTSGSAGVTNEGDAGAGTSGSAGGSPSGPGAPEPSSYPLLEAAQIGMPVSVASGFDLAESPLWDPCAQRLLFTDVTASVIHSLGADGQVSVFMMNTGNANGIAWDIDGSLILAQMGGSPGHIARRDPSGAVTQVDPQGSNLHTPDDVTVRSDGTIYFSDGDFYPIGSLLGAFAQLPVYAVKPGSSMLLSGGNVGGPNGVELSPDENTLYVSAYGDGRVVEFSVAADGTLTKGAPLISGLNNPDSLCLDAAGNLYVGVSSGLQVVRPDGSEVTLIRIPSSQGTTSCTFGGGDGKTLYITSWTTLYKVEGMPIPGLDYLVNRTRLGCEG